MTRKRRPPPPVIVPVPPPPVPVPPPDPTTPLFGTLITDTGHATAMYAAGLRAAMVENFGWTAGANWTAQQARALKAAGLHVTLEPGLHNATPPLPRYVDHLGNVTGRANLTWNPVARSEAERLVETLRVAFGGSFASLDALRVGGGGDVELMYAGGGVLAAYDPVALTRWPVPVIRPGQAGDWSRVFGWYLDELVAEAVWRDSLFRVRGFAGTTHVLLPGLGATEYSVARAIETKMVTSQMATVGRGVAWHLIIPRLPKHFVVQCCSVAEDRGRWDVTRPGDEAGVIPDTWSAMRRTHAHARKNGLRSSGENPGFGHSAGYGVDMRDAAVAQARAAGYVTYHWAHHKQIVDGSAGFTLADYAEAIP